jgi:hypothetical protein
MMQNDFFQQTDRRSAIRDYILLQMVKGGLYAAVVFFGILLLLGLINLVGQLLPEASKQTPPPMPYSQIVAPSPAHDLA